MAADEPDFQVGDTFSVDTWGRLTGADIARRGLDVLAGIVRSNHVDCPSHHHFWCAPPDARVFVIADLYQAGNPQGEHYIGCYLRGADFGDDGVPTIHQSPSLKMVMQLLDDGRVFIHLGPLVDPGDGDSGMGFGLLDQQNAERFVVIPRPVPNVPAVPDGPITFVLQRFNDLWYLAHLPNDGESSSSAQLRVFATIPVNSNPNQFAQVEIDNFPG